MPYQITADGQTVKYILAGSQYVDRGYVGSNLVYAPEITITPSTILKPSSLNPAVTVLGTINPSTPQTILTHETKTFSITPESAPWSGPYIVSYWWYTKTLHVDGISITPTPYYTFSDKQTSDPLIENHTIIASFDEGLIWWGGEISCT